MTETPLKTILKLVKDGDTISLNSAVWQLIKTVTELEDRVALLESKLELQDD